MKDLQIFESGAGFRWHYLIKDRFASGWFNSVRKNYQSKQSIMREFGKFRSNLENEVFLTYEYKNGKYTFLVRLIDSTRVQGLIRSIGYTTRHSAIAASKRYMERISND